MSEEFTIGDKVRIIALPPYIKTADAIPSLKSPAVLQIGEEGVVCDRRPGGYWSVRLTSGAYLLGSQYLQSCSNID